MTTAAAEQTTTEMVTITLDIENTYEGDDELETIHTTATVTVPAPPPLDSDAYFDWGVEHIRDLTGTGRVEGDSWYDVTITASSDPALIGRTFDFGY